MAILDGVVRALGLRLALVLGLVAPLASPALGAPKTKSGEFVALTYQRCRSPEVHLWVRPDDELAARCLGSSQTTGPRVPVAWKGRSPCDLRGVEAVEEQEGPDMPSEEDALVMHVLHTKKGWSIAQLAGVRRGLENGAALCNVAGSFDLLRAIKRDTAPGTSAAESLQPLAVPPTSHHRAPFDAIQGRPCSSDVTRLCCSAI